MILFCASDISEFPRFNIRLRSEHRLCARHLPSTGPFPVNTIVIENVQDASSDDRKYLFPYFIVAFIDRLNDYLIFFYRGQYHFDSFFPDFTEISCKKSAKTPLAGGQALHHAVH